LSEHPRRASTPAARPRHRRPIQTELHAYRQARAIGVPGFATVPMLWRIAHALNLNLTIEFATAR
jgi:hypothetical protein